MRGRREAQRILTDLLEEINELPDALAAAIASQHTDDPKTATGQLARSADPATGR